jgi:CHAT domain-containing protein
LNGRIGLTDLFRNSVRADLVVLSACETAVGRQVAGEGALSLSYGFLSAGAQAVMASLWKIGDQSTARFVSDFYDGYIAQGRDPIAAIAVAQRLAIRDEGRSHPRYWATFQLATTQLLP